MIETMSGVREEEEEVRESEREVKEEEVVSGVCRERGPDGMPLFGNLAELGRLPHRHLSRLTENYGSVIHLKLGVWKTEVVHGYHANQELFLKHGKCSSSRPDFKSYKHYSHGRSLSFQPFNKLWQHQRKVVSRLIMRFISTGFVAELASIQSQNLMIKWQRRAIEGGPFNPQMDLAESVSSFIYSFCYGRHHQLSDNTRFMRLLMKYNPATNLFAMGNNIDLLPFFLRPLLRSKEKEHIERMEELMNCHAGMLKIIQDSFFKNSDATCLQEALLVEVEKMFEEDEEEKVLEDNEKLHREHLLNLSAELLSAGSETSTASLLWLLRYMAKNPSAQKKVKCEIDEYMASKLSSKVDGEQMVEFEDMIHLPYTEACRLEALRCVAVVPFGLPHYSSCHFDSCGVSIAKDTLLFPNLWSIGRDASVWREPHKFIPERHLIYNHSNDDICESDKNNFNQELNFSSKKLISCPFVISKNQKCYPFGVGKRRCVGEQMAKILNSVIFSNIMWCFRVKLDSVRSLDGITNDCKARLEERNHFHEDNFLLRNIYKFIESVWKFVRMYLIPRGNVLKEKDRGMDEVRDGGMDEWLDEKKKEEIEGLNAEEVVEEFGDVMLPSSYRILLERRKII